MSLLTPMIVQYLVGLCCFRNDPDAVDVTVGDMVMDDIAQKERDVDVTVTVKSEGGEISVFKAYEVKHEKKPIDIATVEQLCAKMDDMSSVNYKAIVSSSGYTESSIRKAKAKGVDLYVLKPWTEEIWKRFPDFPDLGHPSDFFASVESNLLYWASYRINLIVPEGPPSFSWSYDNKAYGSDGKIHKDFKTMEDFVNDILMESTEILFKIDPADTVSRIFPSHPIENGEFECGPAWPHSHTLEVGEKSIFLSIGDKFCQIKRLTITGSLQWRKRIRVPEFYIIESVDGEKVLAATAIADYGSDDGKMFALTFPSKTRELGVHQFKLSEKHRNIIKKLKIVPK